MSIHYITCKTIFELEGRVQTLVNPVNCRGVMGRGLALQFKERYPAMFAEYRRRCLAGALTVGRLYVWRPAKDATWVLNFPTKNHWREPSSLEIIEAGLKRLLEVYQPTGITSLAFPLLGCGEGGLAWEDVEPLMVRYLTQLQEVEVYIVKQHREERPTMINRYYLNFMELSADALYKAELHRLPDVSRLSAEQRKWLVARARANEARAHHDLMLCCLGYVLRRAQMIREERQPQQETLDLAQEGSVAMLEAMEKALGTRDPIAYLCRAAQRAMRVACISPEYRDPEIEDQSQKG